MRPIENLLQIYKIERTKALRWGAIILMTLLALFFLVRACSMIDMQRPSYHIAQDTSFYPFAQHDKSKNLLAFSNELLGEIAAEEEIKVILAISDFNTLYSRLDMGDFDAVIAALSAGTTHERYEISDPIYLLGPVLVVKKGGSIRSLEDIENKIVGVIAGASLIFNTERYPSLMIRNFDNAQQALSNLDRNKIDGVILDFLSASTYLAGIYAGKLEIITTPLTEEGIRLVARKDRRGRELIKSFNAGLEALKTNGRYEELLQKWGLHKQLTE